MNRRLLLKNLVALSGAHFINWADVFAAQPDAVKEEIEKGKPIPELLRDNRCIICDDKKIIGVSQNATLTIRRKMIDITPREHQGNKEYIPGETSWAIHGDFILLNPISMRRSMFTMYVKAEDAQSIYLYSGEVILSQYNFMIESKDFSSLELVGQGALTQERKPWI